MTENFDFAAMLQVALKETRITVRLVAWPDEEGARFGRSLLGLSPVIASGVEY